MSTAEQDQTLGALYRNRNDLRREVACLESKLKMIHHALEEIVGLSDSLGKGVRIDVSVAKFQRQDGDKTAEYVARYGKAVAELVDTSSRINSINPD